MKLKISTFNKAKVIKPYLTPAFDEILSAAGVTGHEPADFCLLLKFEDEY